MSNLYKELKRRKVLKTLGVYGAAALVIINLATSIFPYLNLPDWMVTFVIVLVILGFPITFFLSWTYDLKREANTDDKSGNEDVASDKKSKNMLLPITGFLTIIGGAFWVWYSLGSVSQGSGLDNKIFQSIAVLYIENLSNDTKDENICAGLTNSITTAFTKLGIFDVKPRTDVLKFRKKITSHKEISEILGVDAYIEGSLIKSPTNNEYIANITLIDAKEGKNIWANEYNKSSKDISKISNTIASEVSQFLSGDRVNDFEKLNDFHGFDDESFSLMGKGINLLDSKEYEQSISVFDSVLLIEPDNMRAIYSKGRALEGLDQFSDAIDSYNQILTDANPSARATKIFGHPDIIEQGLKRIDVKDKLLVSDKLNIQIGALYRKDDKISEIYAMDLTTHQTIWEKTYPFRASLEIVGNNLVIGNSALGHDVDEPAVYVHSLRLGTLLFSKEFPKEYPEQRVLINVLFNKGTTIPALQDVICLYVNRVDYRSLVMIDPKSNQIILEKIIPMEGVVEGSPRIGLVEDNGKNYLFHEKGLNQYLFEIKSGKLIWNKTLPDDSYHVEVQNNLMLIYSNNEKDVVLQNIVSQKTIGEFELESLVIRGFFWKDNIILNTNNSITSLKTYKPFLRSLHNWTQSINKNDEIRRIFPVHKNLFSFTKSGDLYCLNEKTGELINNNQIGHDIDSFHYEDVNDPSYSHSKSFIIYANGFLIGLDTNNGKTLWKIRELNINLNWVYGRIIVINNKMIIIKKPENNNNIVMKAYNRMTGELLWRTEENVFQGIARVNEGFDIIKDEVWGYVQQSSLYLASAPSGFIYVVDISWNPNKNYISKASIYNNLAYCYKKINNNKMAEEMLNNIINVVDQQNEVAFKQLSDLYLETNDDLNYIKNQVGFHELVFYDDIKRGNIENQLMQNSGLKWVQHFKRKHDFAVHFQDENIAVSGFSNEHRGCSLKYYRTSSGILIGESDLDIIRYLHIMALNNKLIIIGEEEKVGGGKIVSLYEIDPRSRTISNKVFLWDKFHYIKNIYHFDDLYIVDSDYHKNEFDPMTEVGRLRYITAIDMNNRAVLWEKTSQSDLINRQINVELIEKDGLIIDPFSEHLQAISLYSGETEWIYEFDDIDGIKYLDKNSINGDNLYFMTIDDEFVTFDLINKEILFLSDEIYFDYKLNIALLNSNHMLAYTYDGKVILYKNNGNVMVQSWIEDFGESIRILNVKDNTAYIQSFEDEKITAINFDNPNNKSTTSIIWDIDKIFIDSRSLGISIYNRKGLYFLNI